MTFQEHVIHLLSSGFQALYVATGERSRCEAELEVIAQKQEMSFVTWDSVYGFSTNGECKDPLEALLTMDEEGNNLWTGKNVLFVFRNMHVYLEDAAVRQAFQNLYFSRKFSNKSYSRPIVCLSSVQSIHSEIKDCLTVVEYELPKEEELSVVFDTIRDKLVPDESRPGAIITCDDDHRSRIVQSMRGLSTLEAENILCYSLRVHRGFAENIIDTVEDQKAKTIEKSEVLTYVPKERVATLDEIGGYDELKDFIRVRKMAYTKAARELKLDLPKGIVLLGVPGTGKSVISKIISRELSQPLVILNIGAVYGSLVGESERRIRSALNTIDALDGAVVLIDEAEKALGGASESVGDSGVARRVFGTILTWLTEKTSRTFVIMTMNRTRGIPPEFMRKGRFDDVFWVDLPNADERDAILKIHCRKRQIDVARYTTQQWNSLVTATDRCVGSELEQLVCDARFASFAARQSGQPTIEELLAALPVAPIADAERENIDDIRKMCTGKARPVSRERIKIIKKSRAVSV